MLMCYVVVPHKPNQIQNKILNSDNNSQALLRINTVCSARRGSERLIYITRSLLILKVSDKVFSSKEVSFSIIHRLQANVGTLVATLHYLLLCSCSSSIVIVVFLTIGYSSTPSLLRRRPIEQKYYQSLFFFCCCFFLFYLLDLLLILASQHQHQLVLPNFFFIFIISSQQQCQIVY